MTFYNWNVTVTFCSSSEKTTKQTKKATKRRSSAHTCIHAPKYPHEPEKTTRILMCNTKWFRCKFTENEDKLHAMHCNGKPNTLEDFNLDAIDRYGNKNWMHQMDYRFGGSLKTKSNGQRWIGKSCVIQCQSYFRSLYLTKNFIIGPNQH